MAVATASRRPLPVALHGNSLPSMVKTTSASIFSLPPSCLKWAEVTSSGLVWFR